MFIGFILYKQAKPSWFSSGGLTSLPSPLIYTRME